ncbi:MAG: acyltransferase, partial [Methylobacteriaceae bacterium]|nr:acyltransferase [Methylobacteriaceae bacterium]
MAPEGCLGSQFNAGSANRLAFADLLRGIAAFVVVLGHFTVLYLTNPTIVSQIVMSEQRTAVPLPRVVNDLVTLFDLPSMGVAVFFLISGFVIPLSLEGTNTRSYLLKRFLRIFPTYWVALVIGVAAIFASAAFWSKPITHNYIDYFGNTFLIANLFGRFDILSVAWTLQIEIKFYLFAPLFYLALKRGTLLPLLLCGLAVVGVFWNATAFCNNVDIACWDHYRFSVRMIWQDTMYMVYMLIGSILYAHYRKLISNWQAIGGVAFLFGCYDIAGMAPPIPRDGQYLPYLWGLIIFVALYVLRNRITLPRPFKFLADISYSLYVIHPLVGYVTMQLLMAVGLPYLASLTIALALVIGIA